MLNLMDQKQDSDVVFSDVIMLALAGFVTLVLLLLPHLNPPTRAEEDIRSPGTVIVEVRWPDAISTDVDTWALAPGDRPVGYSNPSGTVFNLLRDDLGFDADMSGLNYESVFSRGAPAGEYCINLHLFRGEPLEVDVRVTVRKDGSSTQVFAGRVRLKHAGEELTVVRFHLDDKGALVAGSVHNLQKPLRGAR